MAPDSVTVTPRRRPPPVSVTVPAIDPVWRSASARAAGSSATSPAANSALGRIMRPSLSPDVRLEELANLRRPPAWCQGCGVWNLSSPFLFRNDLSVLRGEQRRRRRRLLVVRLSAELGGAALEGLADRGPLRDPGRARNAAGWARSTERMTGCGRRRKRLVPDADLQDFTAWAFWTGMRKGEIAKLTWEALDREAWTITLAAKDAKTRKARTVAVEGPLRAIVERRIAARRPDCPLVFHRSGEPVREFRKAWATATKRAGALWGPVPRPAALRDPQHGPGRRRSRRRHAHQRPPRRPHLPPLQHPRRGRPARRDHEDRGVRLHAARRAQGVGAGPGEGRGGLVRDTDKTRTNCTRKQQTRLGASFEAPFYLPDRLGIRLGSGGRI